MAKKKATKKTPQKPESPPRRGPLKREYLSEFAEKVLDVHARIVATEQAMAEADIDNIKVDRFTGLDRGLEEILTSLDTFEIYIRKAARNSQ